MAKLSAKEIIDSVKEMTILECKELVDLMKEELGVDPSAVAVAAAPAAGAQEDAGSANKTVVLKAAGDNKVAVIKVIKEATGLGLLDAKKIADEGGNIKENIPAADAEALKAQLEEAGATVELA